MSESNEADSSTEPLMTLSQKYQCLVYYGNANYQQGEYRKAVVRNCSALYSQLLYSILDFM